MTIVFTLRFNVFNTQIYMCTYDNTLIQLTMQLSNIQIVNLNYVNRKNCSNIWCLIIRNISRKVKVMVEKQRSKLTQTTILQYIIKESIL